LASRFVEWLMGLPADYVTDLGLPRTAELRALGNGVVPQQAEEALRLLVNEIIRDSAV
jgi:DNA (cytosine-5)-methyltransferase 1